MPQLIRVLMVDDEEKIAQKTAYLINTVQGFETGYKISGREAIEEIKEKQDQSHPYDVVICDLLMPEKDGIDVLEEVLLIDPDICFIMLTGFGTIERAVKAMEKGAYTFLEKPLPNVKNIAPLIKKGVIEKKIQKIRYDVLVRKEKHIMFEQIMSALEMLLTPKTYSIAIMGINGERFNLISYKNIPENYIGQYISQRGFVEQIKAKRKRIYESSLNDDLIRDLEPFDSNSKSMLVEPLIVYNELIGIIEIELDESDSLTYEDERTILELANTVTIALYIQKQFQSLVRTIVEDTTEPLKQAYRNVEYLRKKYKKTELPDEVMTSLDTIKEKIVQVDKSTKKIMIGSIDKLDNALVKDIISEIDRTLKIQKSAVAEKIKWPQNEEFFTNRIPCNQVQIETMIQEILKYSFALDKKKGTIQVDGMVDKESNNLLIKIMNRESKLSDTLVDSILTEPYIVSEWGDIKPSLLNYYIIAQNHNGSIKVENSDKGTIFTIILPLSSQGE